MIGMYAHHVGSGHLHRARAIRAELDRPARILSSAPGADVLLPLDTDDTRPPRDASAGGTLHWAPVNVTGLTERMAVLAQFIATHRPAAFYVDVSVEVAAFVRLMGVPVITLAMPGERADAPHQLGYAQAAAIIAAWPDWVPTPAHLVAHADRLHPVGGISRLHPGSTADRDGGPLVLRGAGGDAFATITWPRGARILGGAHRVDDPTAHLERASVVMAAAGQNSVADLAATGAPAIVFPQDRPFAEQHATARVLADAELAVVPRQVPAGAQWEELADEARLRATRWHRWQTEGAAGRAARVIDAVAGGAL